MHTWKQIQRRIYQKRFVVAVKWVILVGKCRVFLSLAGEGGLCAAGQLAVQPICAQWRGLMPRCELTGSHCHACLPCSFLVYPGSFSCPGNCTFVFSGCPALYGLSERPWAWLLWSRHSLLILLWHLQCSLPVYNLVYNAWEEDGKESRDSN